MQVQNKKLIPKLHTLARTLAVIGHFLKLKISKIRFFARKKSFTVIPKFCESWDILNLGWKIPTIQRSEQRGRSAAGACRWPRLAVAAASPLPARRHCQLAGQCPREGRPRCGGGGTRRGAAAARQRVQRTLSRLGWDVSALLMAGTRGTWPQATSGRVAPRPFATLCFGRGHMGGGGVAAAGGGGRADEGKAIGGLRRSKESGEEGAAVGCAWDGGLARRSPPATADEAGGRSRPRLQRGPDWRRP